MQNPKRVAEMHLNKLWLAAVVLDGRYTRFSNFASWFRQWYRNKKIRLQVVDRARRIYFEHVLDPIQTSIIGTQIDRPMDDELTKEKRYALYMVEVTRANLLETVKSIKVCEGQLALEFTDANMVSQGQDGQAAQSLAETIEYLEVLQRVKDDCLAKRKASQLIQVGNDYVERHAAGVFDASSNHDFISTSQQPSASDRSVHRDALTLGEVQASILRAHPSSVEYYSIGVPRPLPIFWVSERKAALHRYTDPVQPSQMPDIVEYEYFDHTCAKVSGNFNLVKISLIGFSGSESNFRSLTRTN